LVLINLLTAANMFMLKLCILVVNTSVTMYEGNTLTTPKSTMAIPPPRQRSTSVNSASSEDPQKTCYNSGYASGDDEIKPAGKYALATNQIPANMLEDVRQPTETAMQRDGRIPISLMQISLFINLILLFCVIDPNILVFISTLIASTTALLHFIGAINRSHLDFSTLLGFRLDTTPTPIVYKEVAKCVRIEKHITRYIVKDKAGNDANLTTCNNEVATTSARAVAQATKLGWRSTLKTVIAIASIYTKQTHDHNMLVKWLIDTQAIDPYHDKPLSKKTIMRQWLLDFSDLNPYHFWVQQRRSLCSSKPKTVFEHADRIHTPIATRAHLVAEECEMWRKNPQYQEYLDPHPDLPAATNPNFDRNYASREQYPLPNGSHWLETSTRNVYIDMYVPGRWAIMTEHDIYVIQWDPKHYIWFCADYGFAFILEDDHTWHVVSGTDPMSDPRLRNKKMWKGTDGPFWKKELKESLDTAVQWQKMECNAKLQYEELQREQDAARQAKLQTQWAAQLRIQQQREKALRERLARMAAQANVAAPCMPRQGWTAPPRKTLQEIAEENRIKREEQLKEWEKGGGKAKVQAQFRTKM
jgi:hypothetical protein